MESNGKPAKYRQVSLSCKGHTRPVVDISFTNVRADGRFFLLSASKDGSPMLRDGPTGDWIGTFTGHKGAIWSCRSSLTGDHVVTGSADFSAKLWETNTGSLLATFDHQHIVRSAAFLADGSVVTGGHEKMIRRFDPSRPDAPTEFRGHKETIRIVMGLGDPNLFFSAGDEKGLWLWDARQEKTITQSATSDPITSIEQMSNGNLMLAYGKTVAFLDRSLTLTSKHAFTDTIESASMHPSGTHYVAGGADCHVYVVDALSGAKIDPYKAHHGAVHAIRYSPLGRHFASGSEDGTIRLWQDKPGDVYGLWEGPAE